MTRAFELRFELLFSGGGTSLQGLDDPVIALLRLSGRVPASRV